MSYKYYRFNLLESEDLKLLNQEETVKKYQTILNTGKEFGIIRISFDLLSPEKSISILCNSETEGIIEQEKWTQFLLNNQIHIKKKIEHEVLEDHEPHHDHCDHDGHHDHHDHHGHHGHHDHHDHHDHHGHHGHHDHHDHQHENHWLKAALGLLCGIGLLALSLASFNLPMIAYSVITGISSLMTLYLGHRVYQSAWQAWRQKKWDMSTLYTISTLSIIVVSMVSLFVPGLPMILESAPFILGFWHLGEAIEHGLLDQINEKLDVRDCAPLSVLLKSNPDSEVSVKQLIPNDIINVKKGEVIPVDGVLTQPTLLYTTRIDGSPYLKQFNAGEAVKAGMSLADHLPMMEMRVTKTYQNSHLSLIAKNIKKANDEKAPVEEIANKILDYFVPGLLAVAITSGVIIGLLFPPALTIQCVISVLVSACPCALSLITPMAIKIGMKKASEKGVLFKNGKTLQAAADINTVVFDLNGTLTEGKVIVNTLNIKDKKLLSHVALLESLSDHPIAETIKSYINQQGIDCDKSLKVTSFDKSHHSGIKGMINGETFMVGNKDMLFANGIKHINAPYNQTKNGSIYIVRGSEVIGQIALTDPLRKDAKATIKQLESQGKKIHICTGADRETAVQYAKLLGFPCENDKEIDDFICANTVGAAIKTGEVSKESYIKKLQEKGRKVAMVGDAANDITAIQRADMGIAVKSSIGDTLTEQYAGIVIQRGLLFPIAIAFDVGTKTKQNIFQNLFVSLTYNSVITLVASGLFLSLGFALNPAVGVALMVVESAIVLTNLYRLKQQETLSLTSDNEVNVRRAESEVSTSSALNSLGCKPRVSLSGDSVGTGLSVRPVTAASSRGQPGFFAASNSVQETTDGIVLDGSLSKTAGVH